MRRPSYFLTRLLATAAAVVAPLLALTAYTLYANLEKAKAESYDDIRHFAESASRSVESALDITSRIIMLAASRDEVQTMSVNECNSFLKGLEGIDASQGIVLVVAIDGSVKCSSSPTLPNYRDAKWFSEATGHNGFVLTSPFMSRVRHRPAVMMSYPIRDSGGKEVGIVAASIALDKLEADMRGGWPAERGVVALVSADDRFLVRSPGTREMFGKQVSQGVVQLRDKPAGEAVTATGTDGLRRVFSSVGISRFGLRVAASMPEEDMYAEAYADIRRSAAIAGAALLAAGLLAWLGARSLALKMRSLMGTVRAHAKDRTESARADASLPGEFGDLAVEMNAMLDARVASEVEADLSKQRESRLARFYECLLRTNQAIARIRNETELYQRVCEICVDAGQANLCWIGTVQGEQVVPVAFGGAAAGYASGLELRLGPLAVLGECATEDAIHTGETVACNDYMNEPRTLLKRERASAYGIRSCCSVPLKQGGVVVAVLNLYASETHVFDEELVRLLSDLSRDISAALDAIGMAHEHARTLTELRQSESSLAAVVESSQDAIATMDSLGTIRLWNPAAEEMFGASAKEVIGQSSFAFIPPAAASQHEARLRRFTTDFAAPTLEERRVQVRLNRKDGSTFPAWGSFSRVRVGGETLLVATLRDATIEVEAERARHAAAESEASNVAKSDFMSRMSHELRTPLNVVLGFSQLLQESAKKRLDERERKHLDLIFLAGAQLRALVDDVLDFSVIESGRLQLSLKDFDLTELLEGVVRMSEATARAVHVRIDSKFEQFRPFELRSDPIRLRQVLLNLLSNAIKYNRAGGSVTVSMDAPHGLVCIEVKDTGLGMTEEQVAGLYQPFNRLGREKSEVHGTGIGMVLVRQPVELMGGSLTVKSVVDEGTVVRVELPRAKIAGVLVDLDVDHLRPLPFDSERDEDSPHGLVLYIEDNPINIILIEEIVREWPGVQLVIAQDGESGIQKALELAPDLVLLDMQLPDMTGLDVLSTFNTMGAMGNFMVVGLSASAMDDEVASAREAGVLDYWEKPVDVAEFRKSVRKLLKKAADAKSSPP